MLEIAQIYHVLSLELRKKLLNLRSIMVKGPEKFCKMLSVCEIYVYMTKVPIPFHSKESLYLQILVVL
jgi:hypothetical protein